MNQHVASIIAFPVPQPAPVVLPERETLIHDMAMHLIAGMTEGLDLSSDFDVIRYLKNTTEAYRASVITSHMDEAIYEARQTVIAAIFGTK